MKYALALLLGLIDPHAEWTDEGCQWYQAVFIQPGDDWPAGREFQQLHVWSMTTGIELYEDGSCVQHDHGHYWPAGVV